MEQKKGIFLYTVKTSADGISNPQFICSVKISDDDKSLTEENTRMGNLISDEYIKYYNKPQMNKLQQEQYNTILKIAINRNYKVISSRYENREAKMIFLCSNGHLRNITSRSFKENTRCAACNNNCPILSEKNFRSNIENLEAKMIGNYINCSTKIECLCKKGHTYYCTPASVRLGMGNCLQCKDWSVIKIEKRTSEQIYQDFIDDVTKLGGKVIGKYVGSQGKIECICINHHICYPYPGNLRRGKGMCVKCADRCPIQAGQKFYDKIIKSKGTIIGKYNGSGVPVECVCSNGHTCHPVPDHLKRSGNICSLCSGCSIVVAEQFFKDFIFSQGGTIIGKYITQYDRIKCICSLGHICNPTPKYVKSSGSFCFTCNGTNGSYGEKLIYEILESLGVTFYKEKRHPLIPKLRFDFCFRYNGLMYYIEHDGKQHFFDNKFFYKKRTFEEARQKDLIKNHIINLDINSRLIRLDYKWSESSKLSVRQNFINNSLTYIKECFLLKDKIFVKGDLYEWINTLPSQETINKYYDNDSNYNPNKINIELIDDFDNSNDDYSDNDFSDDFSDDDFSDNDFSDNDFFDDDFSDDDFSDDDFSDVII